MRPTSTRGYWVHIVPMETSSTTCRSQNTSALLQWDQAWQLPGALAGSLQHRTWPSARKNGRCAHGPARWQGGKAGVVGLGPDAGVLAAVRGGTVYDAGQDYLKMAFVTAFSEAALFVVLEWGNVTRMKLRRLCSPRRARRAHTTPGEGRGGAIGGRAQQRPSGANSRNALGLGNKKNL